MARCCKPGARFTSVCNVKDDLFAAGALDGNVYLWVRRETPPCASAPCLAVKYFPLKWREAGSGCDGREGVLTPVRVVVSAPGYPSRGQAPRDLPAGSPRRGPGGLPLAQQLHVGREHGGRGAGWHCGWVRAQKKFPLGVFQWPAHSRFAFKNTSDLSRSYDPLAAGRTSPSGSASAPPSRREASSRRGRRPGWWRGTSGRRTCCTARRTGRCRCSGRGRGRTCDERWGEGEGATRSFLATRDAGAGLGGSFASPAC